MNTLFPTETVKQAAQRISCARRIVILTHLSPDGDAMGSSLAMRHYLLSLPSKPEVYNIVPNAFPDFLAWMPMADQVRVYDQQTEEASRLMQEADLFICTDFNEPYRIGALGERLVHIQSDKQISTILIDHHLHPAAFADVVFSYPESPSASQLVYQLITCLQTLDDYPLLHQPLTLPAATCIYTGMMTDTGNFSFNSNHPDMYEIVSQLVQMGVDKDAIYNRVFNAYSADRMRLVGYCLYHKMQIFPEHHAALIYLSRRELYRFNFQKGDAEGIVNMPLQIKDIYYSCFMREDKVMPTEKHLAGGSKTKIKISMRSQGDRPVNLFCHDIYHGGGHKNASGGEYYGPLSEAVQLFEQNYQRYLSSN